MSTINFQRFDDAMLEVPSQIDSNITQEEREQINELVDYLETVNYLQMQI